MRRTAVHAAAAAAALAAACGDSGDSGSAPPALPTVTITSPALEAHTRDFVTIQLVVSGCEPYEVILRVDGSPLVALSPPYQYTWDTRWDEEGRREVTAQASCKDGSGTSAPAFVWVDRTPPAIAARAPAPGSDDAWVRDPVVVTFSEPVDPRSVEDAIVIRDGAGEAVEATTAVSADGTQVTVTPAAPRTAPETMSVEVRPVILDLAGNAAPPREWSFSYPLFWHPTRGPLNAEPVYSSSGPDVAVEPDGDVVVAWAGGELSVLGLEDGAPAPLWSASGVPYEYGARAGTGETGTYVAYTYVDDVYRVAAGSWTAGELVPLGGPLGRGRDPDVAVAADGVPAVAWVEVQEGQPDQVRVSFYEGGAWRDRGATPLGTNPHSTAIAVDALGNPAVAFRQAGAIQVKAWDGAGWATVGGGPIAVSGVSPPVLALAFDGTVPYVATVDGNSLRVFRTEVGSWSEVGLVLPSAPGRYVSHPAIACDGAGRVFLAWTDGEGIYGDGTLLVAELVEGTWVPWGETLNASLGSPAISASLALDPASEPVLAWLEYVEATPGGADVHLARVNR